MYWLELNQDHNHLGIICIYKICMDQDHTCTETRNSGKFSKNTLLLNV